MPTTLERAPPRAPDHHAAPPRPAPRRHAGDGGGDNPARLAHGGRGGGDRQSLPVGVAVALIGALAALLTYLGMLTQIWANMAGAQLPAA